MAGLVGLAEAEVEPPGAAEVLPRAGHVQREVPMPLEDLVGGPRVAVVHDVHGVDGAGLRPQPVEQHVEQLGAVVGDDDDRDTLGHVRNLRCPVKSPRRPARIARALSRILCRLGLVNV